MHISKQHLEKTIQEEFNKLLNEQRREPEPWITIRDRDGYITSFFRPTVDKEGYRSGSEEISYGDPLFGETAVSLGLENENVGMSEFTEERLRDIEKAGGVSVDEARRWIRNSFRSDVQTALQLRQEKESAAATRRATTSEFPAAQVAAAIQADLGPIARTAAQTAARDEAWRQKQQANVARTLKNTPEFRDEPYQRPTAPEESWWKSVHDKALQASRPSAPANAVNEALQRIINEEHNKLLQEQVGEGGQPSPYELNDGHLPPHDTPAPGPPKWPYPEQWTLTTPPHRLSNVQGAHERAQAVPWHSSNKFSLNDWNDYFLDQDAGAAAYSENPEAFEDWEEAFKDKHHVMRIT